MKFLFHLEKMNSKLNISIVKNEDDHSFKIIEKALIEQDALKKHPKTS